MQHEHQSHNASRSSVIGHLILLVIALLILGGVYLYFQSMTSVLLGSTGLVFLILVHLGLVAGILYLLRGFLLNVLRSKLHGSPAEHTHTQETPKTEGITINWASTYDWLVQSLLFGQERKLRESIVALARIRSGEKVLDVGCGTGTQAILASLKSDPSAQIYGTDAAPEMIGKAREKAARAGAKVVFQTGLVETIDFPENTLDVVMNSFMVHHLPGELKNKAFAEMYRVLKPGGRLLVVDFEPPTQPVTRFFLKSILGPGMLSIDNSQTPPLLQAAGFVSVKTGNAGHKLATYISAEKPR